MRSKKNIGSLFASRRREPGSPLLHVGPRARMAVAVLVAVAAVGGALAAYFQLLGTQWVNPVVLWTARSTGFVLANLGTDVSVDGSVVSSGGFAYAIVPECTALGPVILFVGAVLAYPSGLRAKGIGVLLGAGGLAVVNLIRLVSLFYIGSAFPRYLNVAHLLMWQSVLILIAILLWLFWVGRFVRVAQG